MNDEPPIFQYLVIATAFGVLTWFVGQSIAKGDDTICETVCWINGDGLRECETRCRDNG